jgi:hypothetical protein
MSRRGLWTLERMLAGFAGEPAPRLSPWPGARWVSVDEVVLEVQPRHLGAVGRRRAHSTLLRLAEAHLDWDNEEAAAGRLIQPRREAVPRRPHTQEGLLQEAWERVPRSELHQTCQPHTRHLDSRHTPRISERVRSAATLRCCACRRPCSSSFTILSCSSLGRFLHGREWGMGAVAAAVAAACTASACC